MTVLFGVPPSDSGEIKKEDALWWSYESALEQTRELDDHITSIASQIHPSSPIRLNEQIRYVYLNMGVMTDTYTGHTVEFPVQTLDLLRSMIPGLEVEVICYPTNFDEDECDD
jgi:hypothetical protein